MSSSSHLQAKKPVLLRSDDGEIFEVEESVAAMCGTIKLFMEEDCASNLIPVPRVKGKTLLKVIDYCKKHAAKNVEEKDLAKFDMDFVDVEVDVLCHLLSAAHFLKVIDLTQKLGEKIASIISAKSPEEIRETFHIKNDFTPEEEEEIRNQNAWAFV